MDQQQNARFNTNDRDRLTRLETRMDYLEKETHEQTNILKDQNTRLGRMEKILWALLGGLVVVEFLLKVPELIRTLTH